MRVQRISPGISIFTRKEEHLNAGVGGERERNKEEGKCETRSFNYSSKFNRSRGQRCHLIKTFAARPSLAPPPPPLPLSLVATNTVRVGLAELLNDVADSFKLPQLSCISMIFNRLRLDRSTRSQFRPRCCCCLAHCHGQLMMPEWTINLVTIL